MVSGVPQSGQAAQRIAIQGERGSNSHLAAHGLLGSEIEVVPCPLSAEVVRRVLAGEVDAAVLPIENTLHGSVAEHYDLLLGSDLRIDAEYLLRVEHHLIAGPGVPLEAIRVVLSHPVALSQCRRFLAEFQQAQASPFYDTAGSVRHIMQEHRDDAAGIAPRLAAELYGAEVLRANIEDNPENYTRFHLLRRLDEPVSAGAASASASRKLSVAFALEHRPGTLAGALSALADSGVDLTKIESRPVPGKPWEYIFFLDFRFEQERAAERALAALEKHTSMLKQLGRYPAA